MTDDKHISSKDVDEPSASSGVEISIDHKKVHKNFRIRVTTMAKLIQLAEASGIPKEKLALMVMRAQRKGLI